MAKMEWQEDEPKDDAKARFDAAKESFYSLLDYLVDSSLSANTEIATLKRLLAENNVQFDLRHYQAIYKEEQHRELKKAASYSDRVARATEKAAGRLSGDAPKQDTN